MKLTNYMSPSTSKWLYACVIIAAIWAFMFLVARADGVKNSDEAYDEMISSIRAESLDKFESVANRYSEARKALAKNLQDCLVNPKSSNLTRCEAAFSLGQMRLSSGVDVLARSITLELDPSYPVDHIPIIAGYPAMDALIKIGNPAIPAVMRNLIESDDLKVADLSLKVLYRIDGDKDIVQLRLQKALKAETDSKKQQRLRAALKALAETSFAN
jgi:hypothetical protein